MADKTLQPNTGKKVTAHARNLRIAPRKLRLVANLVKQMRAQDALVQLVFTNKKGASIVSKLIASAIANAEHNFSLDPAGLYISSITCDAGAVMRRYMPRARGSASPLNRRMSHLHVVLEARAVPAGKKAGRFAGPLKRNKTEAKPKSHESEKVTAEIPEGAPKPEAPKANEQIKQNRVQQKRRLFNRKAGE